MSSLQISSLRRASVLAACVATGALGIGVLPAAGTALAAVAQNQAPRSAVALATDPAGTGYAFFRGQGDALYLRTVRNGTWSGQTSLGGTIVGAPAAAFATMIGTPTVVVGARGTDNALWVRTLRNGTWSGWRSWGGSMSASPALAGASDGSIYAAVRGPDGSLLAAAMEPGTTAGVLVWENTWAAPFASAARRSGGQLIANGRIPIQAILASLEADEEGD